MERDTETNMQTLVRLHTLSLENKVGRKTIRSAIILGILLEYFCSENEDYPLMAAYRTVIDFSIDGARRANSTTVYRPPNQEPANKE